MGPKIRTQIADCALFLPLISANTQSRLEGYFRLEWRIAEQRSHLMAKGKRFLVPVCIDDTREKGAQVPDAFLEVQWTRLAAGAATPPFIELVKRLLSIPSQAGGAAQPTATTISAASAPRSPGVPLWAIGVIAALAFGVAYFAFRPSPKIAAPSSAPSAEKTSLPVAPLSDARQLVEKARALYEPWDFATRDDFNVAEQLLKKATDLDPTDGEAWAHCALMSCGKIVNGFDRSEERKLAARVQGEHAVKFAPNSDRARFAHAFSLRFVPQMQDECLRLLREEASRQTTNVIVMRTVGSALRNFGELEQSLVYYDRALAIPPWRDPITLYNRAQSLYGLRRFAECEADLDEALARAPNFVNASCWKLALLLDYHEDLPRAREYVAKLPPDFLFNDVGVFYAALVAYYSRDAVRCLETLRQAPDFIGGTQNGPKAYFTGRAQEMLGNPDAARTDYRAALRLIDERLASQPNSGALLAWRARLLAALDDRNAAEPLLRELQQRIKTRDASVNEAEIAAIQMHLGRNEEALASLESYYANTSLTNVTRFGLKLNPLWDPLRGQPRFEALLKITPAVKSK